MEKHHEVRTFDTNSKTSPKYILKDSLKYNWTMVLHIHAIDDIETQTTCLPFMVKHNLLTDDSIRLSEKANE